MHTAKRLTVLTARTLTALLLSAVLLAGSAPYTHAYAQRGGQSPSQFPLPNSSQPGVVDNDSAAKLNLEERQAQARNTDRQKRLVADSDKLLQLATQLHQDVGKTDKNILSMDVVRRASEIEKLAHDVKERMKG